MCVSIPGQITNILDSAHRIALVDILGQPRTINLGLLSADEGAVGDWVLLAVGDVLAGCPGQSDHDGHWVDLCNLVLRECRLALGDRIDDCV